MMVVLGVNVICSQNGVAQYQKGINTWVSEFVSGFYSCADWPAHKHKPWEREGSRTTLENVIFDVLLSILLYSRLNFGVSQKVLDLDDWNSTDRESVQTKWRVFVLMMEHQVDHDCSVDDLFWRYMSQKLISKATRNFLHVDLQERIEWASAVTTDASMLASMTTDKLTLHNFALWKLGEEAWQRPTDQRETGQRDNGPTGQQGTEQRDNGKGPTGQRKRAQREGVNGPTGQWERAHGTPGITAILEIGCFWDVWSCLTRTICGASWISSLCRLAWPVMIRRDLPIHGFSWLENGRETWWWWRERERDQVFLS